MSQRECEMDTRPLIDPQRSDTQPLPSPGMAVATAARRAPLSDQTDTDRELRAVDHQSAGGSQPEEDSAPLFEQGALENYRSSWGAIQTGFVDNPVEAVKQADELVAEVMKRLGQVFAELEQTWGRGDDVSTEDLRLALRRYRSFFDRLLSV